MNWWTGVQFLCLVLVFSQAANSPALVANCPYHAIADRNVFNLQPAPPVNTPPQSTPAPKVMPQVFITGITDVCGRRQALVEMTEPGKPSIKAVLTEGGRVGPLEVVQIDIKEGQVKVNVCGEESVLMLRAPPSAVPPPTGQPALLPPSPFMPARR
jgi:hypothetical protein